MTDAASVRLLLHPRIQHVLSRFLEEDQTVSGAAQRTGFDIRAVHRDVGSLCAAGLLRAVRQQPRAGRAVVFYRASAPAYFVPQSAHPSADGAEFFQRQFGPIDQVLNAAVGRDLEQALEQERREWGTRLFLTTDSLQTDQCFYDAELRSVLTGWQGPKTSAFNAVAVAHLTPAEAEEMQRELIRVLLKLKLLSEANVQRGWGQPVAVRLLQVHLNERELAALNLPEPP